MNFLKHLKSQLTGKTPEPDKDANRPGTPKDTVGRRCVAAASDGWGERTREPSPPNSSIDDLDPDHTNRNGKIARLPRSLRERVNQAIYRRFTANQLARELNQMPEVQAMLAAHFDGHPIVQQNISEWKRGGYRDWLQRQQILEQQSELTADAKDMAETADGMADSLFGMLTLDYARLMMNRDGDEEAFEKKRKALSTLAQDVVRLRRIHLHARRVQIQETRLDNDTEKTEEQLFTKFTEWTENPAVRKACILAPMERDRRLRVAYEMRPTPEDPLVQRETEGDPYFGHFDEKQSKNRPLQTEKSPSPPDSPPPPTPENESDVEGQKDTVGPRSSAAESANSASDVQASNDVVGRTTRASCVAAAADREVSPTTASPAPPSNPYAGRYTQDVIAEIEANYAQQKADRLNRQRQTETAETPCDSEPKPPTPKPELSPYEKALLEGKSFLEALYAQYAQTPKPKEKQPNSVPAPIYHVPHPGPASPLSFYGPAEPPLTLSTCHSLRRPLG